VRKLFEEIKDKQPYRTLNFHKNTKQNMFKFVHDYKGMPHLSHTQMVKIPVLYFGKYSNKQLLHGQKKSHGKLKHTVCNR